jgi:zinc D-Ala-D-Ala dipeptidase
VKEMDLLRLPAIPIAVDGLSTVQYRSIKVDKDHALNSENLVDLRNEGIFGFSYYFDDTGSNAPYLQRISGSIPHLFVRSSVAKKLKNVNLFLQKFGIAIFVHDAFRPIETQLGIWKFFWDYLRVRNPEISNEDLNSRVLEFVSDPLRFNPYDSTTWPIHITGSAIDLTLCNLSDGVPLDLGAHFDQMTNEANTDFFERKLLENEISPKDERLLFRRLLYFAMSSQGFTNYPLEFWHFDWGNQLNRLMTTQQSGYDSGPAWYGVASI